MKKTAKKRTAVSAESIARRADQGKDVSRFFTNRGTMMKPIQRVNVDLTAEMLQELDEAATEMNVSRQAVMKVFIRRALDERLLAQQEREIKTDRLWASEAHYRREEVRAGRVKAIPAETVRKKAAKLLH
jgi:hypothetical protein